MNQLDLHQRVNEAAGSIRSEIDEPPAIAIVLGSGLDALSGRVEDGVEIPFAGIPHFPVPSVEGHRGLLLFGKLGKSRVVMLRGRIHYYEGHDLETVTFPVRVFQRLGVNTLILTAATGGIRANLNPGDLLCVSDHINFSGMNPLRGGNDSRFGPRFPDMTEVYSSTLRALAQKSAGELGIQLHEGVYGWVCGPSYETPAEIRMLQTLGCDVVGMSTVPEAVVARHGGMNVLAFAMVTNKAAGLSGRPLSHQEVLEIGGQAGQRLGELIERIASALGS